MYKVYIVYIEYSTSSVCTVQAHLRCIVPQKYLEARDAPETSWYQWVTFMMVLQAAAFYLPFKVARAGQARLMSPPGLVSPGGGAPRLFRAGWEDSRKWPTLVHYNEPNISNVYLTKERARVS